MNVVILGRGISLNRLDELKELNISYVILVNCFWDSVQTCKSYYKDPIISNFLQDKKIILIRTPCADISKINNFLNLYKSNICKKYKTLFSNKIRIGKKDNLFELLPDNVIDDYINLIKEFPNTGTLAVSCIYAIKNLNVKNIYIFGLDFYKGNYLFKQNHNYKLEKQKSDTIQKDFINFFSYYDYINFHIYSSIDLKINIKNIIIN